VSTRDEDLFYRSFIDRLVSACREGQGQIGRRRVEAGVWNVNARADQHEDQHEINLLLARLPQSDRAIVARMIEEEFSGGVHTTLVALHEASLAPFDKAYEGTPFHDFVGRLMGWEWPTSRKRH
jgi:hypothetical protein